MINFFNRFLKETGAAVTVDWVVLTAAVVGLGLMGAVSIGTGATGLGDNLGSFLASNTELIQNR